MNNPLNIDWDTFVFRCSELGHITSAGRGVVITDKQKEELDELLAKVKLTEKQAIRRDELIAKRDSPPQLSAGAKSYIKERFLEVVTGRTKFMETKYTEKGTLMEHEAITLANKVLNWGLKQDYIDTLEFTKNRLTNDYITGEMDLNNAHLLADVKAPWNIHTFPFFEEGIPTSDYYWQLQGYMMLTGHKVAQLVYVLVDTPKHLVTDEIRRREWKKGYIEMPESEQDEITRELTFTDLPDTMKVRRWMIQHSNDAQETIKSSVEMARNYLRELAAQFSSMYNLNN